ncbi:uncharacterized protein DUF3551 [Bradyrhizobium stylosanthis]|uniref:Uncharacterized protein DUF3551 n=2 Tax=Bradyrhizobium stylosanthis TaxID=1803665 RepID=A0A560EC70_9BRAD|nr:DUF3551 domain-containing protein [Bradyrhizobium stylosanthis]TWB06973.1 uncharacterized protein DUF3551 [Bradyrhizobium stylosanthis]
MRKAQFVLGITALVWLAGDSPARADYAWCIQDSEYGYPGDCSYQTREQCRLSVSGRKGFCGPNPAVVTRPPLPPALRGRHVPPY